MCALLLTRRLSLSLALALTSLVILASCRDSVVPTEPDGARPGASLGVVASTDPAIMVGAGDIAACGSGTVATAALLDDVIGANTAGYDLRIFTTGDNAYSDGTYLEFMECYDPTWGSGGKKAITSPTPGNHEYITAGAAGYFEYFGAAAQGPAGEPYYSYDIGTWHSIALNSEIGVGTGDPQLLWLEADLQAEVDNHLCTIAYWHQPLFSSGQSHGNDSDYLEFWETLYAFGVDVVLGGHDHLYERFGPQDPYAVADPAYGIRQFTVGTGGAGLDDFSTPQPNSEFRYSTMYGVLKLTLLDGSYEWEFIAIDSTIVDSGSGSCHGPPGGGTPAPGAAFTWSCGGLDCEFTDLSSVQNVTSRTWDFGDGGGPVEGAQNVMHTYQEGGSWEVTLTVTDNNLESYSASQIVTAAGIDLTAAWTTGGGRDKVSLTWSGASGRSVDVYRDGAYLRTTRNDGELSDNATLGTHVYKVCEEGTLGCSGEATAVYPTGGNESPIADFTSSCVGLVCDFFDQSSDDGPLSRDWAFGDGGTSTAQAPSHTYASAGTYDVTLTVTDAGGLTDTANRSLTVSDDPVGGITLTVSGSKEKGVRYADLSWTGASPGSVDVYRDAVPIATAPTQGDGTGSYRDDLGRGGGETFTYRVCDASVCSDPVQLTF